MEANKKAENSGSKVLLLTGVIAVISSITIIASVSWFLYEHTVNLLTDNLRQRLLSIATTEVANIDWKDVDALKVEADWQKPEWRRVVGQLKRAKDNNDNIVFMYIFRKTKNDPTKMEFIADAESLNPYANTDKDPSNDVDANGDGTVEPDGADQLQWPGQEYPEPPAEAFDAYEKPLTNQDLYADAYGQVLTGYAPIKDDQGNAIAVLGTDIKANDFLVVTRQTLYPFLLFIVFLVAAIVILSLVLISLWNKRIQIFAELDRQKDELLSIVSHQLAAPVTAIKWYLELMTDSGTEGWKKDQVEGVQSMQSIALNLADLVTMILDVSRIQLGKMKVEPQPLDLNGFFKEILDVIDPKANEKKVKFVKTLPASLPTVLLDKRLTRMTVENLLTNAVKYTPEGGDVKMTVELRGEKLYCEVRDTGCGIPKADQPNMFGKMFRASNVRNTIDGNGFGLYVAKGAIESQGGKIWFESEEGKGTAFFVELPMVYPKGEK